ncbi:hypothetical protein DDB_G0270038 [Dictyostelium discoideum AX4]|uniref:Uncharacterized protein n=1 Tax=Dictyostelium discoideum TaxID=44689 RepID=Q55CJ1_DICDI|nr:hypothetical protein DDB_G0270038 [Dictyostelium discoideum AX4]EAL72369.1 hypothetical protein DDB_G0270038 [Dictyostelium discoideum AX4]|eukprot:XP_646490.1 hypothetical protein DDB_G0270038 [Dictyostelium discoideum AX4]
MGIFDLCKVGFTHVKGIIAKPWAQIQKRTREEFAKRIRIQQEQKEQPTTKPTNIILNESLLKNNNNHTTPSLSEPIETTPTTTTNIDTPITTPVTNNNKNNKIYIDLVNIKGIGPKTIKELNGFGITTSEQLSQLSDEECDKFKSKIKKIYSFRSASQALVQN